MAADNKIVVGPSIVVLLLFVGVLLALPTAQGRHVNFLPTKALRETNPLPTPPPQPPSQVVPDRPIVVPVPPPSAATAPSAPISYAAPRPVVHPTPPVASSIDPSVRPGDLVIVAYHPLGEKTGEPTMNELNYMVGWLTRNDDTVVVCSEKQAPSDGTICYDSDAEASCEKSMVASIKKLHE